LTVRLEADPKMFEPFLEIVRLFDARKFPLSIKCTSFPIAGDAGSVIVTELLIPPEDVLTNN